jgi:hypothetical protein
MTTDALIDRLTETLLAALNLLGDDETYGLVYSAIQNVDEVETPDPRLQAVFIVEAAEAALGLGLDEVAFDAAVAAVVERLPTVAELEIRWRQADNARAQTALRHELAPDAHLEAAYEDWVNGGGLVDFD